MTISYVPLDRISDNPFQARLEHRDVPGLAAAILRLKNIHTATSGLIQVPPGRVVNSVGDLLNPEEYGGITACLLDEPGATVQLAAGHRRLRAFRHLQAQGEEGYDEFPVYLQPLSDEAMVDVARSENVDRNDLSAIEEAMTISLAVDHFGWTQVQVAERWGLSQSAVANKLRLLTLPQWLKDKVHRGEVAERAARALLPLQAIGVEFTAAVLARPGSDELRTVQEVEAAVSSLIDSHSRPLGDRAPWLKLIDWMPAEANPAIVGPCTGCHLNVHVLREDRCTHPSCHAAKTAAWHSQVEIPQAALAVHDRLGDWFRLPQVDGWNTCDACQGRADAIGKAGWYKAGSHYNYLCGPCWTRANLPEPAPRPAPDLRPAPSPSLSPAPAPAPVPAPASQSPRPAPTPLAASPQAGGLRPSSLPTQPAPAPAHTVPRPVPNLQAVPGPTPAAVLITIRIQPVNGSDPTAGRALLAIGPEGCSPTAWRSGSYTNLDAMVRDLCQAYFEPITLQEES